MRKLDSLYQVIYNISGLNFFVLKDNFEKIIEYRFERCGSCTHLGFYHIGLFRCTEDESGCACKQFVFTDNLKLLEYKLWEKEHEQA